MPWSFYGRTVFDYLARIMVLQNSALAVEPFQMSYPNILLLTFEVFLPVRSQL